MNSNFNPLSPEELVSRINKIPRIRLAQLPTALEYAPNISKELNINLYIKRDDCTALAFGGNKTRQLEFLLPKVLNEDFDILVAGAYSQSNWCRQITAAARKLEKDVIIVIKDKKPRIIDFDKKFIPTNWDEFINFIKTFYNLDNNYFWSPEIGTFREQYKTLLSNRELTQPQKLDQLKDYIIQELGIQEFTPETWKEFINKAMVYQMSYLFMFIESLSYVRIRAQNEYNHRISLDSLISNIGAILGI